MADETGDRTATDLMRVGTGQDESPLVEITTHIRTDQALALEMLANAELRRVACESDRARLIQKAVQEALDLLLAKRFAAVRLTNPKPAKKICDR